MMKAAERKKLIGQKITWEFAHDRHRGTYLIAHGIVVDVKGKNILLADGDWKWLPDMINIKIVAP
jgi:hypothetical protein